MINVAAMLVALVVHNGAAIRAAPSKSAPKQAVLYAGDWLEVRGRQGGYLKVYDHRHERPGFVRDWLVREYDLAPESAAVLRTLALYHRDMPGAESLGIGFAALYLRAAEKDDIAGDVLVALGTMADRLAARASGDQRRGTSADVPHHLEVAKSYGIEFASEDSSGALRLCYDGSAYAQALALSKSPSVIARAALGLAKTRCSRDVSIVTTIAATQERLRLLMGVDVSQLTTKTANQVRLRIAELSAEMTFYHARRDNPAAAREASERAIDHLARVDRAAFDAHGSKLYDRAAIAVGAAKWARMPTSDLAKTISITRDESGASCFTIRGRKGDQSFERCSHGVIWQQSVRVARDGRTIVVAVQPLPSWVELWVFRRGEDGWSADALVPAVAQPEKGYVEWAGFSHRSDKLVLVREALVEGHVRRRFQALDLGSLSVELQATSLRRFATFKRHRAAEWVKSTVALR